MTIVPIQEAQDHLAELVKRAVAGEPFMISDEGKLLVTVTAVPDAVDTPPAQQRHIGFMDGQLRIPKGFDTLYQDEIIALFEGTA